ncbi:MAG: thiamine pyrophosphate-dependent enzyme [Candidatus Bathyarchaeota archaeon]
MKRFKAIEVIVNSLNGNELIISTTGLISRELHSVKDSPSFFYMLGSMGLASSIGLGLALSAPKKTVLVIDGDGSLLMNLGSLATIGNKAPKNFVQIVLDNSSYESTGGQPSSSSTIKLQKVALAAGFRNVKVTTTPQTLAQILRCLLGSTGPSFVLVKVEKGRENVPRIPYGPELIKNRFIEVSKS